MFGIRYDLIMIIVSVIMFIFTMIKQKKDPSKVSICKRLKIISILLFFGFVVDFLCNFYALW